MKITDVRVYTMDSYRTNWSFIKLMTDEGLHGWGEASLGTNENALEGMVKDLTRHIIGRNPFEIEKMLFEVHRDMYWKGGAVLMSAMSGIEMAMWDICGKALNVPVSTFFGGKIKDDVRMYANAWFVGARTPEDFAARAKQTAALGVTALKWDPFGSSYLTISNEQMEKTVNIVGAVREAVGSHVDLLIECHGRFQPTTAVRIARELEEFKPMLIEEPCVPENMDSYAYVRQNSHIPVSGGERVYGKSDFLQWMQRGAFDIIQPDIFHTGGLSEGKKIAAMADAMQLSVSFHNPSGPVSNAAILQLAATVPNFLIHEIMLTDCSFRKTVSTEEVVYHDGLIRIPDLPGLGIDLDEDVLMSRPYKPRNLRHYVGTVTDIRPVSDTIYYFKGLEDKTF